MANPIGGINNAISAYSNTSRMSGGEASSGAMDARDQGDEFADLVKSALKEAQKIGERGEQMTMAAIADKADINKVVTAVAEAEVTLQTVVAVRDKVLEAYKEIIRMPM